MPTNSAPGIRCDQIIGLGGLKVGQDFPDRLRRIHFVSPDDGKHLEFVTNNFELAPLVVTGLYNKRWQIELFFKWIKQHLRIKSFLGTSENAVKTQLWVAITVYVLVAILKKELQLNQSLYTILQVLSLNLFEKTPFLELINRNQLILEIDDDHKQLTLFDF